jgi:hypothetical protein
MITKKTYERLINEYSGCDFGTTLREHLPTLFECMFFEFWLSLKPKVIDDAFIKQRPMKSYRNDPCMIKARFDSVCKTCRCNIPKGVNCYYWPKPKHVYCLSCGETDYKRFLSSAADEEVYHRRGNPYCG